MAPRRALPSAVRGQAPWEAVAARTRAVLAAGRAAPGHVFNLGHGVIPATDPDVLTRVVDLVHTESARA